MDNLTIKSRGQQTDQQLIQLAKHKGFSVSNPDQERGNYIDIIVEGKQKIIGYDLIAVDSLRNAWNIKSDIELDDVEKWIDEKITK